MAWSCGIVGLPNAGKSTLFKALTGMDVVIERYPFSTIDPNVAVVPLRDRRLESLAVRLSSDTITPAVMHVVDVAGLVKGASRGEGLGNQFLGELRLVDVLIHVVAGHGFAGDNTDPALCAATVNTELLLADLETVSRRRERIMPKLRSGDRDAGLEVEFLDRLETQLNEARPARIIEYKAEERLMMDRLFLLTAKKMVYLYNSSEDAPGAIHPALVNLAREEQCPILSLCARLEAEIVELPENERMSFLEEYGIREPQTEALIGQCYRELDLITFFTVKGDEAKAWIAPAGINAVEAAGKVHSDMARGFINAEVVFWERLLEAGSLAASREKGTTGIEGRDYAVKDGDVLYFKFRS